MLHKSGESFDFGSNKIRIILMKSFVKGKYFINLFLISVTVSAKCVAPPSAKSETKTWKILLVMRNKAIALKLLKLTTYFYIRNSILISEIHFQAFLFTWTRTLILSNKIVLLNVHPAEFSVIHGDKDLMKKNEQRFPCGEGQGNKMKFCIMTANYPSLQLMYHLCPQKWWQCSPNPNVWLPLQY